MKKKMDSVAFRVNALILTLVVVIAGGLIASASIMNRRQVDEFYGTKATQMARTLVNFLDGDRLGALAELLLSGEFQELRQAAAAEENAEPVESFLRERGMLDYVTRLLKSLDRYRDEQGGTYVYLLDMLEGRESMRLADPDEPLWEMGLIEKDAAGFERTGGNQAIPPTLAQSSYGWLISCYEPIADSSGEMIASVGIDINITDVIAARNAFLFQLTLYAAVIAVIFVALAMYLMRNTVNRPIAQLSKALDRFGGEEGKITRDQIISLSVTRRDEIGNLYEKTRQMEERLVDYMDNLAAVTAEKERIGAELNIAARIQADMLPRIFPPFPERHDFEIYATMDPAKEVGGDFYDFFLVDENRVGLVIADVSGKGVPAALFMVIAKTLIKNRALQGESPSEILYHVNNQLCDGNEAELFVTVWLAILNLETGVGLAANAGHEHPALRRAGGKYELVEYRHSPALAVMENIKFREHEFRMCQGDSLFVYTDGVPEATDAGNGMFGKDRMLEALNENPGREPEELLATVRRRLDDFVGEAPQFDDITMLGFHYRGGERGMKEIRLEEAAPEQLGQVLEMVDSELEKAGCPVKTQMRIDVAVEEIYVNIAHYAYAPGRGPAEIRIAVEGDPAEAFVTFTDWGVPYNPLEQKEPDITLPAEDREIGGLGIFMVRKSMDGMEYARREGKNILTLRKRLRP